MFKYLIKISYRPAGLESGKYVSILKPCGCHPRQSRSLNHTLESVKLAEINKKANYHPPAGTKHGTGGANSSGCLFLPTRIRAFPYRNVRISFFEVVNMVIGNYLCI